MDRELDTSFAKVVSDPEGRDYIYIEGIIIPLAVEDQNQNNVLVGRIVRGLRSAAREGLSGVTRARVSSPAISAMLGQSQ